MRFDDSMINKDNSEVGLGTDKNNTYTFDTKFKEEEPKIKEKTKPKISFKFKFRSFNFNGETAPYFILMLLLIAISVTFLIKGNFSYGIQGMVFSVFISFAYNYANINYDNNHNLLFWNVTTTLQALFKYTAYNLLILDSKILMIGAIGSTITQFKILSNFNSLFVYMIIIGGFLTFINRRTELLSVIYRVYGIMLIISLVINNIISILKARGVFFIPSDIVTFIIIYTIGVIMSKIEIEQPIEY